MINGFSDKCIPYIKNKVHVISCKHKKMKEISLVFLVLYVKYNCGNKVIVKNDAPK